jgi:hypothetical protein
MHVFIQCQWGPEIIPRVQIGPKPIIHRFHKTCVIGLMNVLKIASSKSRHKLGLVTVKTVPES